MPFVLALKENLTIDKFECFDNFKISLKDCYYYFKSASKFTIGFKKPKT